MKSILEYFKIERVSHPATSDIQLGMKVNENISESISKFISEVFDNEIVKFHCRNNGIDALTTVTSESKKLQFSKRGDKFSYIISTNEDVLLESINDGFSSNRNFKTKLKDYGTRKGWNPQTD